MEINAKFAIVKPLWIRMLLQGIPGKFIGICWRFGIVVICQWTPLLWIIGNSCLVKCLPCWWARHRAGLL